MDRYGKITLACGLGGGIGALVALQVNQYFWWLGMLAGGLVGYLSYEFKEVMAAVPRAWQKMVAGVKVVKANGWLFIRCSSALFAFFTSFAIPILLIFSPFILSMVAGTTTSATTIGVAVFTPLISCPLFFSMFFSMLALDNPELAEKRLKELSWRRYNLITVYGYHLWRWLGIGLWWVVKRLPMAAVEVVIGAVAVVAAVVVLARFVKYLFILIHSELRLLCGCDAAIGAAIGYFAGNVIIGALAGAAVGVLNFELISKRLLKLVPVKTER